MSDSRKPSARPIEIDGEALVDFVNSASIGLRWLDADGTILWANPADYEPLGYTAEEYIGRSIVDFHTDGPLVEGLLERLKEGEQLRDEPARLRCKDGSEREVRVTSSALFDDEGRFVHTRCITRDVTTENAAERRLRILGELSDAVAPALDPDDAVRRFVRFAVSTVADYCIAYRLEGDAIRRVAAEHADPRQRPLVEALVQAAPIRLDDPHGIGTVIRTGQPVLLGTVTDELLEAVAQSPEHRRVLLQLAPRSGLIVPLKARNRMLGALSVATTDHSGRRYRASDLTLAGEMATRAAMLVDNARLYQQAQQANRARDEMLAIVSHDLRSPLNTIRTACELLELSPPEPQHTRTRTSIRRAAHQMDRLVSNLLDVARIDEDRLSVEQEPIAIRPLLEEVLSVHGPVAENQGVKLVQEVAPDLSRLMADRGRLCQALSNLVDNAIKFTPKGGEVKVSVEREDDAIRLTVSDTGPGIPEEQLPHLFDRFWQAEGKKPGVGLGLAIAKGVAEAHGGEIQVSSPPGGGARFSIYLPIGGELGRESLPERRILVVDDDHAFREEVIDLLRERGHYVMGSANGKEALALLRETGPPDLIFLDLMMPVMDGWELFEVLRSEPVLSEVPLVILSAVEKRWTGIAPGPVAGFLEKPFEREELLRLARGRSA